MSEGDAVSKNLAASDDWPLKAANTVVAYVDKTKVATTGKALVASRTAVYLIAAAFIAVNLLLLALIAGIRFLGAATAELGFIDDGEIWLAYYIMAALFLLVGLILWHKRGK